MRENLSLYKRRSKNNTVLGWVFTELEFWVQSIYYRHLWRKGGGKAGLGKEVQILCRLAQPTGSSGANLGPTFVHPPQSVAGYSLPRGHALEPGRSLQLRHPWGGDGWGSKSFPGFLPSSVHHTKLENEALFSSIPLAHCQNIYWCIYLRGMRWT